MKNNILKMSIIVILALSILFIMTTFSKAASFDASISKTTVNVGETFTVTVRANNAAGNYEISASNSNVSVVSGNTSEFLENASATVTYKATSVGSVNISARATDMTDLDNSSIPVTGSRTFAVTIKAVPTPTPVPSKAPTPTPNSKPNTTPTPTSENKSPDFTTVSKIVYTTTEVNLRESWSTSSGATRVPADTELRLTGISNEKVNGYVWYRVTYDGKIRYVVREYVKEKDENEEETKSNANLKSLVIEGVELTPTFNADVTDYTAKLVGYTETKIDVKAEPENEKATVKIEGNTDVKIGENIIKITVTAEDGTTKNYTINAIIEETEALGLKTLKIKDINFKFDPTIFDYEIQFEELDKLEIEAIPNFEDATVEIIGNENLVDGENIITIIVTSADGEETATYQIKANKIVKVEEARQLDMKKILITALIAFILIVLIVTLITIYIKGNNNSNIDYVYEDNLDIDNEKNINEEIVDEETKDEAKEENENKKATVDDLFKDYNDQDEPKSSKRGKGKHSR